MCMQKRLFLSVNVLMPTIMLFAQLAYLGPRSGSDRPDLFPGHTLHKATFFFKLCNLVSFGLLVQVCFLASYMMWGVAGLQVHLTPTLFLGPTQVLSCSCGFVLSLFLQYRATL